MPGACAGGDIVICNKVRMCSRTLSGAENLKLICVTATGINNIDPIM